MPKVFLRFLKIFVHKTTLNGYKFIVAKRKVHKNLDRNNYLEWLL